MCPIKIEEDITLLASGELNVFRAWTIRRHLAQCDDCQKVWNETQQVWHNAISHSTAELPIQLRGNILRQLPASSKTSAHSNPQRLVFGVLAAMGLMGIVFLTNLPKTRHTTEGIAFAQVEEAMGNVHTVKWRENYTESISFFRYGRTEVTKSLRPSIRWARINQPALSRIRAGHKTVTFANQSFLISKDKSGRFYCAFLPYGITPLSIWEPKANSTLAERIRQAVLFSKDFDEKPTQWTQKSQDQQYPVTRSAWKRSEDLLEGKKTLLFESSLSYDMLFTSPDKSGNAWHQVGETWRFWVDPSSYRIVRREVRTHYSGFGKTLHSTLVSDQFRYNDTPPPDMFEIKPPVGSKYTYVPAPQQPATIQEQNQIKATIQSALNAWNRENLKAFGDTWDFDYEATTEEQKEHQKRAVLSYAAKNLKGKVTIRKFDKVSSRISGVYCRKTATDPFPPRQPVEFGISMQATVLDSAGIATDRFINLNLSRQTDGSFKIVRWLVVRIPPHHQ
jgi:hypothetical protein